MAKEFFSVRRGLALAGFAAAAAVIPLAVLASPSGPTANNADCAVGFYWDAVTMACVPVTPLVGPVLGPAGPVGVGGLGPVAGPAGPVGAGGVVGPVGRDPILGPVGPVGVGPR